MILNYYPFAQVKVSCNRFFCSPFIQKITSEKFELHLPRAHSLQKINVKMRDLDKATYLDFILKEEGYIKEETLLYVDYDKVFPDTTWNKLYAHNLILYQRNDVEQFDSVDNFLQNIPKLSSVAQYNFDLSKYYQVPGYIFNKNKFYQNNLKGAHTIYAYIDNHDLEFSLEKNNIEKFALDDKLEIYQRYDQRELINEYYFDNSGKIIAQELNLPTGVYEIKINIEDDAEFIFSTNLDWFVFNDHINTLDPDIYSPENEYNLFATSAKQYFIPPFTILKNVDAYFALNAEQQVEKNYIITQDFDKVQNQLDKNKSLQHLNQGAATEIEKARLEIISDQEIKIDNFSLNFMR